MTDDLAPGWTFQSSPGPKAGCYDEVVDRLLRGRDVSILTRPEGRVLLAVMMCSKSMTLSFNPHPARRPGATRTLTEEYTPRRVSILTRPEGRVLHRASPSPCAPQRVSILTRPEGRVLRRGRSYASRIARRFQSSPGPKAGCYNCRASAQLRGCQRFQSSPGPKAGCYARWSSASSSSSSFNPHPARRPGATFRKRTCWSLNFPFQSSPGPKAGCYCCSSLISCSPPSGFNPHPARRPGATGRWGRRARRRPCFNPHPARRPGATIAQVRRGQAAPPVSILTRPEGRVLRPLPGLGRGEARRFNPHPARRPGATWVEAQPGVSYQVSILTRPEGRVLRAGTARYRHGIARFNPHPARRPGATVRAKCEVGRGDSGRFARTRRMGAYLSRYLACPSRAFPRRCWAIARARTPRLRAVATGSRGPRSGFHTIKGARRSIAGRTP